MKLNIPNLEGTISRLILTERVDFWAEVGELKQEEGSAITITMKKSSFSIVWF